MFVWCDVICVGVLVNSLWRSPVRVEKRGLGYEREEACTVLLQEKLTAAS